MPSKSFNPIALRTAKTRWSFDHPECIRFKSRPHFRRVYMQEVTKAESDPTVLNTEFFDYIVNTYLMAY